MNRLHSLVPCVTLAAFSALALAAQQAGPVNMASSHPAAAVPVQSTASTPEAANAQLRPVKGELVTRINAKKAKTGQPVVIKTTEKAAIADGVVIPKGSKILGHITDVQPHTKQNPNSKVTLEFDKAQLKGGQTLPIKSVIESVAPAVSVANNGVDPFGTGVPAAGGGGAPAAGSPSGSSPSGSPGMQPTQTTQTQGSTEAMMNASRNNGAPKPGTVVATQGNVAVKTTDIPGVLIATNTNGQPFSNASGALLGAKQNVDLNGGTKVTLAIASMPASPR